MAFLTLTCPHCLTARVACDVAGLRVLDAKVGENDVLAGVMFCRACNKGISVGLADKSIRERSIVQRNGDSYMTYPGDLADLLEVVIIWPEPRKATVPDHVPDEIAAVFREAEEGRLAGHVHAPGGMYRKVIDTTTQAIAGNHEPAIKEENLKARIKKLAAAHLLTPAIADWADNVRDVGNGSVHKPTPPTPAEIEDMANLTRMILVYLYEMPERVRRMRAEAAAKKAAAQG